jgi:hypothetical protein
MQQKTKGGVPSQQVELERRMPAHSDDILCLAFCPPCMLVSGSYDGEPASSNQLHLHPRATLTAPHRPLQHLTAPHDPS